MKKYFPLVLGFLIFAFLFTDHSFAQIRKAYILSEGGFSAGSSRLSMYSIPDNNFTASVFSPGNLGLYSDGLVYHENFLYVLEQGSFGGQGKIYKLDTNGTVINSRTFGTNPYSLAISNGKIYTTNGSAHQVIVLDINNFNTVKTITVGAYPQEIIAYNNKVFVCNTSEFGGASDSTVSVINTLTDSVIATINVTKDPSSLALTNDNKLLIGCPGGQGKIYKVDPVTHQKLDSFAAENGFDKDIAVDRNSDNIYYINYINGITRLNLSSRTVTHIINNPNPAAVYFYGYNFDYTNGKHYVMDAKNFTINGAVNIYGIAGGLEQTFATGIAPRRITFKTAGTTSITYEPQQVKNFDLKQNYPNPFNPSTTIEFTVKGQRSDVKLFVYDINGKIVSELVNETLPEGKYKFKFNANNLASGIYYYKLISDNFSEVKKMMLIK
ncbi:MAG TPA: T9SS type A sorting domain-containing protein [Ignavibacteria bacterium]|nr:T9SS type A sorting domain-containing protein [Ignavibacteria bacterium]